MTGISSASSDKSGKQNKHLPLSTVKDEFASSSKRNSCMKLELEILKENHETLKIDYDSLQERIKLSEETYEVMKKLSKSKTEELEVRNARLVEDCMRERNEKDKYKKMVEEMESERKAMTDELKTKEVGEKKKLENKYVELAERFGVIEAECSYLKSLYDAEVAASGLGETENLMRNQETITPRAVTNQSPPFFASPSSSSSSSSSDGYDVVFKRPANWPEWAMPKGPGDDSNK